MHSRVDECPARFDLFPGQFERITHPHFFGGVIPQHLDQVYDEYGEQQCAD